MPQKINTRIENKHDLEINWNRATFIPLQGELIIYDIEVDSSGNTLTKDVEGSVVSLLPEGRTVPYTYERFKIGDGVHIPYDLPFVTDFLQSELEDVKSQVADLLYKAMTISSFSHNAGTKEIGSTVTSVTLSWTTNKTPTRLTLDGELLANTLKSRTLNGLSITADKPKTWTLTATDERGHTVNKTTSITFCNGIYYGVGDMQANFTSNFVTSLTKRLQTAKAYDFTVNPSTQFIYYAVPKRLGTVTFKVGGFQGGFEAPETVSVTNNSGYTEDYYVYRSTNRVTGSIAVDVT